MADGIRFAAESPDWRRGLLCGQASHRIPRRQNCSTVCHGSRKVVWQVRSSDPSSSPPVTIAEALPMPAVGSL